MFHWLKCARGSGEDDAGAGDGGDGKSEELHGELCL